MIQASNHKLWVTAVALDRLGADFLWIARVQFMVDGRLVITGGGVHFTIGHASVS
jgi:uncharacterized protein (DUF2126 family)